MMKQEDLFKKLGFILNELNDQYQFLAQNPQQLNELELELFLANASFLADHALIVKKLAFAKPAQASLPAAVEIEDTKENLEENLQEEQPLETVSFIAEEDSKPEAEHIEEEELHHSIKPELEIGEEREEEIFKLDNSPSTFEFILNDHSTNEKFDFEEKSVDELFDRPLSEAESKILEEKKKLSELVTEDEVEEFPEVETTDEVFETDEDEIGPEPFLVPHKEEVKEIEEPIFDLKPEDIELEEAPITDIKINSIEPVEDPTFKPTLNDILAGKTAHSNINTSSSTPITDLKQAINLNDKLLYIKDLFNGYNLAYAEAIEIANKLPNFETADNFFQKNYAIKNNWSTKQATVDKFYQLLNQRFK